MLHFQMIFFSIRLIYLLLCGDSTHLSWQNKPQTSPFMSAGFVPLQGQEEGKETERNTTETSGMLTMPTPSEASLLPPPHLTFFICCFFPPSFGSSESRESLITSANFLIKCWLCKNLKKLSGSRVSHRHLQDIKVGPSTCQHECRTESKETVTSGERPE